MTGKIGTWSRVYHAGNCFTSSSTAICVHWCSVWESQVTVSAIRPLLKHITTSLLSVSTSDCMLIKDMKENNYGWPGIPLHLPRSFGTCRQVQLPWPEFKTNALPDYASTIAQLKAEAKEIVESLDGAAEPEGAPPPPKQGTWEQYCWK